MILGVIVASITVQTFPRDENGDFILQPDGSLQAVDTTLTSAWVTLVSAVTSGPVEARTVVGTFHVFEARSDTEPVGTYVASAVWDPARHPEQQAWEALIAAVGDHEVVSHGLPSWWPGVGHGAARIGALLTPAQHAQRVQATDYNLLGLVFKDVWLHGMPIRRDGYREADVERYEPTGQPVLYAGALPCVSEYLIGRPDDPTAYKHLVWWRIGPDAPNETFPGEAGVHPNVYATLRRPPIGGDVEQRDRAWRDGALTRAMHVAAAGIIGFYAPSYPEVDPTSRTGQRFLLDLERDYLTAEQQFFINRGGTALYAALQASDKPWLDIPGVGGFATLRARMLDELTPWAP